MRACVRVALQLTIRYEKTPTHTMAPTNVTTKYFLDFGLRTSGSVM